MKDRWEAFLSTILLLLYGFVLFIYLGLHLLRNDGMGQRHSAQSGNHPDGLHCREQYVLCISSDSISTIEETIENSLRESERSQKSQALWKAEAEKEVSMKAGPPFLGESTLFMGFLSKIRSSYSVVSCRCTVLYSMLRFDAINHHPSSSWGLLLAALVCKGPWASENH